jgi:hypothetical protein
MVIHWNLNMRAVETWKRALDPENITALPDDVLLRSYAKTRE